MTTIDMMSVDEAEAEMLMFHHLKLAARFFEVTPLFPQIPQDEFSKTAISAWLVAMEALYPGDEE